MPPRAGRPGRGRGGPPAAGRGGPPAAGRGGTPAAGAAGGGPHIPAQHVQAVGVRRPAPGTSGRRIVVTTNHYAVDVATSVIHHYDVVISPDTLPVRFNFEIIRRLQEVIAPAIFTPRAVYDGRKNMFSPQELDLGETNSATFDVTLDDPNPNDKRGPKVYKVKLTWVASINSEVLARFLQGQQSHDNTILTAITALNVVIRMQPSLMHPFNARSFFTDRETVDVGGGIVLWRGYFQSIRPAIRRMLINVDISTAAMYKDGPLLDVCLAFLNYRNPADLTPGPRFGERERLRLSRFISSLRVDVRALQPAQPQPGRGNRRPRVIRGVTRAAAAGISFDRNGQQITITQYYQQVYNYRLKHPGIVCVEVGNRGDIIPIELCQVLRGQLVKKQLSPEITSKFVEFSTKAPVERLRSIEQALGVLAYGQSEYVRQFGLTVQPDARPLSTPARVLNPPTLRYGAGSKQQTIDPRSGSWNLVDKKFYSPAKFERWVVVVYENDRRFNQQTAQGMVQGLLSACDAVGIAVRFREPVITYENPQGRVDQQLKAAGGACREKTGGFPNLIVAVLPEGATDLYVAIKHFGDVMTGVATQCMKSNKCGRAREQYFANICLKINVKLGGINSIPDPRSVAFLTDPKNPTIVMGADVMHPPPGAQDRPSFAALVANVDSDTSKYIADLRVQTGRREMITDLEAMSQRMLQMYMEYRKHVEKKPAPEPKRIIFYRDGVSEGEFQQVVDLELPRLKRACQNLKINPKITLLITGKRHHVRFFPQNQKDADRSGNCPAGTVVDEEIVNPIEFDWYLQSHAGLLGTSRPAHYVVLHDDNNLNSDGLQALTFALCHVYARATRSVSIPAPVYYAHIVCSRAKIHYDPSGQLNLSDSATAPSDAATATLEAYRANFRPVHGTQSKLMYFS
ncbi:argonaute-like protein [Daedalea quercina L-15889]|uniref:Argonaute-like protein n=1 Tax=Daedalea quercina L-15889 TaxID=1314783 RepID=A0A165MJH5_9APHY|nr:argonaute-like protein [Daedalea quercina L-15889]